MPDSQLPRVGEAQFPWALGKTGVGVTAGIGRAWPDIASNSDRGEVGWERFWGFMLPTQRGSSWEGGRLGFEQLPPRKA